MELSSKHYHENLISRINEDSTKLKDDIIGCSTNIDIRIESIRDYKKYLYRYYNLTIGDLKDISSVKLKRHIDNRITNILHRDIGLTSILQAALTGLMIAKRIFERYTIDFNSLDKYRVDYTTYKHITATYNSWVVDELLEGRRVKLGNGFGSLFIKMIPGKVASEINTINWKASSKRKKAILTKGGIPYLTKDAEECKANGVDYNGEQWCIKHDLDSYPYIGWRGRTSTFYKEFYKFEPSRTNNTGKYMEELLESITCLEDINKLNVGIVKKLSLYISFNPKQIAKYFKKL